MLVSYLRNTTLVMEPFVIMDIVERSACQQWCLDMMRIYKRLPTIPFGWLLELPEAGMEAKKGTPKLLSKVVKTKHWGKQATKLS